MEQKLNVGTDVGENDDVIQVKSSQALMKTTLESN